MFPLTRTVVSPLFHATLCVCLVATAVTGTSSHNQSQGLELRNTEFLVSRSKARNAEDVKATLQVFLSAKSVAATRQLDKIEAGMYKSAQALPKTANGQLAPRAVRYLVHGYFAQEHGWLIRGLGKHTVQRTASEMQHAGILQDRAPELLEALLHAKQSDVGLSLRDAAAMAAALERLIVDESVALLESAFLLNGWTTDTMVDREGLRGVLMSYLLLFELGSNADENAMVPETHQLLKEELEESIGLEDSFWAKLDEFQTHAVQNFVFEHRFSRNPFLPWTFSFEEATHLVETLARSYGRWQDTECLAMKEELMNLDLAGFGQVPLRLFYSQPESAIYRFGESVEYLRAIGALEEASAREPHIRIANYLAGPSNCVAGSGYYYVCCLSECESLMGELEGLVAAPSARPDVLLPLVAALSSTTVDAPWRIPEALIRKLHGIASQNGGEVPLHGRLFAQWLHYAFPLECRYPQAPGKSDEALSPSYWVDGHSASPEEIDRVLALAEAAADTADVPLDELEGPHALQWSDEEEIPFQDPPPQGLPVADLARYVVWGALLVASIRAVVTAWTSVKRARLEGLCKEKVHLV